MSVRQYIGARYVPRFSDVNNGNWSNIYSYEPLIIVKNGNDYYTSKKSVPVGIAITNTEYWALTGNYNGAIASLDQKIDTVKTELETDISDLRSGEWLTGKRVIIFGDSTIATESASYVTYMENVARATGCTIENHAVGGTTMANGTNNGVSVIGNTTLTGFDYCVLAYGTNEWQGSYSAKNIRDSVDSIIAAVKAKNPLIGIIFITPYYSYHVFANSPVSGGLNHNQRGFTLERVCSMIHERLEHLNVPYVDLFARSTCNESNYTAKLLNDSGGIYVHPNPEFKKEIAQIFINGPQVTPRKHYVPMFNDLDFERARRNFSDRNDYTTNVKGIYIDGGNNYGETIKLDSNGALSTPKAFLDNGRYRLRGRTTAAFTFTIPFNDGNVVFNINAGDFDIDFDCKNGFPSISLSTSGTAYISDLQLYIENDFDDVQINNLFGACQGVTPAAGVTFPVEPRVSWTKDGIIISAFEIQLANTFGAGNPIMTLPAGCGNIKRTFINGMTQSKDPAMLEVYATNVIPYITMAAGRYFFPQTLITNQATFFNW